MITTNIINVRLVFALVAVVYAVPTRGPPGASGLSKPSIGAGDAKHLTTKMSRPNISISKSNDETPVKANSESQGIARDWRFGKPGSLFKRQSATNNIEDPTNYLENIWGKMADKKWADDGSEFSIAKVNSWYKPGIGIGKRSEVSRRAVGRQRRSLVYIPPFQAGKRNKYLVELVDRLNKRPDWSKIDVEAMKGGNSWYLPGISVGKRTQGLFEPETSEEYRFDDGPNMTDYEPVADKRAPDESPVWAGDSWMSYAGSNNEQHDTAPVMSWYLPGL